MGQDWNSTDLPWQSTALPWKSTSLPWNDPSLPWKGGGAPAVPVAPALTWVSDSSDATPEFDVDLTAPQEGDILRLYRDGTEIASHTLTADDLAGYTSDFGLSAWVDGAYEVYATVEHNGSESAPSNTETVTIAAVPAITGIVALGDSLTEGNLDTAQTYPRRLSALTGISADNQGAGGKAMITMATDYDTLTAPLFTGGVNGLLLEAGTNDIKSGVSLASMQSAATTIMGKPQAAVRVICNIPARNDSDASWTGAMETKRQDYNAWLAANYQAIGADYLVDLAAVFTDPNDTTLYLSDKIHFTRYGFQIMAETIRAAIGLPIVGASADLAFDTTPARTTGTAPTYSNSNKTVALGSTGNSIVTSRPITGKKSFGINISGGDVWWAIGVEAAAATATIGDSGTSAIRFQTGAVKSNGVTTATGVMPFDLDSDIDVHIDDDLGLLWWTTDGTTFYGGTATAYTAADVVAGTGGFDIKDVIGLAGALRGGVGAIAGSGHAFIVQAARTLPTGFSQL